jgi:uncharacterized membrane protein
MKITKSLTFAIGAILYLGSLSLLNDAYAHNHADRSPVKMLLKDLDLSDEQRKEVRSIMSASIKEGRTIRAEMREESMDAIDELKDDTHVRLATILSDEQMAQFDKNSQRMEKRREKMRDRKMNDHHKGKGKKGRKDKKRHNKKRHKQHHKK